MNLAGQSGKSPAVTEPLSDAAIGRAVSGISVTEEALDKMAGLVCAGGGARGAYQAGVLKRIGEMKAIQRFGNPFQIIGGSSAGAINGAMLAAGSNEFGQTTKVIAGLWARLQPSDVFRCDVVSHAHNSLTWMLDVSFGAILGGGNARSLLDASPLRHYLAKHLRSKWIQTNIDGGHLYALSIAATNYNSGKSYQFIQGRKGHPTWTRSRRVTVSTKITADHISASAAIPLVFQPVWLDGGTGSAPFGDGCVRLQQPLSPAIRLGAEKLLAIGVRGESVEHQAPDDKLEPSVAQIMGVLFNVMFLDHLSTDIDHLNRLNSLVRDGRVGRARLPGSDEIRSLQHLLITPSVDLSSLAAEHQRDMPYLVRYLVNNLGRGGASSADLMSYLLFASKYTEALVEIGYRDAAGRSDEIESFLFSGAKGSLAGRERAPLAMRRAS